jgi:hypothetical protein
VHFLSSRDERARILLDVAAPRPEIAKPGIAGYFDDVVCRGIP